MSYEFPEPVTLMRSLDLSKPPDTFLLNRYCPQGKSFKTPKIIWEYKNEKQRIAPAVNPRKVSVALDRDDYEARECEPPYFGLHRPLTMDDLRRRVFGEAVNANVSLHRRMDAMLLDDARQLRESIIRREIFMVSRVMQDNCVVLVEMIDDATTGNTIRVKFYDGAVNPAAAFAPATPWNSVTANILDDLDAAIDLRREDNLPTTEALMSPAVLPYILRNEEIQKLMDNRRIILGQLAPHETMEGVAVLGDIVTPKGRKVTLMSYDGTYSDPDGGHVPYIDEGNVILAAKGLAQRHYGAVEIMHENGEPELIAGHYVTEVLVKPWDRIRVMRVTARVVPVPVYKNAFTCFNVLA